MTVYNLTCQYCEKQFKVKGKKYQKYCSINCGARAQAIPDPDISANGWTEQLAYITGMIWADGCLSKDGSAYGYRITIALIDKPIMKQLHKILTPQKGLYKYKPKRGNMAYILVTHSEELIKFLRNIGLTERKSKKTQPPKNIPTKYIPHFIRGFFDGDGSISFIKKPNRNYPRITFTCGDKTFAEWIQLLLAEYKIHVGIFKDNRKDTWYLHSAKKSNLQRFARFIYTDDMTLYMKRKYKRFQDGDIV